MIELGERFDYPGYFNIPSHCLIWTHGNAVLCTQAEQEDAGTSITNQVEVIAELVCKQFGIPPLELVWIEHYRHTGDREIGETFDSVTFRMLDGTKFHGAQWKHLEAAAAFRLLGIDPISMTKGDPE